MWHGSRILIVFHCLHAAFREQWLNYLLCSYLKQSLYLMIANQTEVMSARELKMLEDLLCGLVSLCSRTYYSQLSFWLTGIWSILKDCWCLVFTCWFCFIFSQELTMSSSPDQIFLVGYLVYDYKFITIWTPWTVA